MNDGIGIEFISLMAMPPVAAVATVAALGCTAMGIALAPITANPYGYAEWSLRDPALRRATAAALEAHGVAVSLGEGFLIRPGVAIADAAGDLDAMAELGAARVNVLAFDPDPARMIDQLGAFADLAAARGMAGTVEFMPGSPVGTLAAALAAVATVGRARLGVLLDCMHFARTGGTIAEIAAAPPDAIAYLQLCDVPMPATIASYPDEARHERRAPGDGDLPLAAILAAMPGDVPVGLELPMLSRALAGGSPADVLRPAVAAARALLSAR